MSKSDSVKSDIEVLKRIALNINEKNVADSLDELTGKLTFNLFYLVIVGLFKRGKSSVINALTGQELAPVAVTPVTSVITFFRYAPETGAEVYFKDGRHIIIDPADVSLYISEENNPKNKREVEYVVIFSKSKILENLILVDTPGLGSLFSHNTATTVSFLPKIDAALFVMSADVPISKADEEFLKQIRESIPNVLFILNKSDLLSREDLDKMISYNLNMLKEIFGNEENIELIPVSAREYFRQPGAGEENDHGNIALLRNKINSKILSEKDKILMERSIRLLLSYADHLGTLLKVKIDTLQMPVNELEQKREAMQKSIDYLASGKVDFDAVVKSRVQQLIGKVTEVTEQKRRDLENYVHTLLITNSEEAWKQVRETDADRFSNKLAGEIIKQYDELKNSLEESVKEEFANILLQYSTLSQSFIREIIKQMQEVLGIQIEGIISAFDLDVYSSFYFKTETNYAVPSIRKSYLYRILPDFVVKRIILKQIYRNSMELVNPNAGKMRGDIDYKISESYRKFKYHFDRKIFDLLQSLKKMIDESIRAKSSLNENIEVTVKTLKAEMEIIGTVKKHYM